MQINPKGIQIQIQIYKIQGTPKIIQERMKILKGILKGKIHFNPNFEKEIQYILSKSHYNFIQCHIQIIQATKLQKSTP